MKFFSLLVLGFSLKCLTAQVTVVIQPDALNGKDALLANCIPCGYLNSNSGTAEDFATAGWTNGGAESDLRSLIEFDFSSIPSQSVIVSATLSLYHNPSSQNGTHSSLTGSNASTLKRVTGAWDENTVTWNNQPTATNVNEVYIPQSTSSNQNYTAINVIGLVQDIVNNPGSNHGFLFQSINEDPYKRLIFASSDHPNSELHPKITIEYRGVLTSVDTCETFQPTAEEGKDALLANCIPCGYLNTNYGSAEDFASAAWTNSGADSKLRSLMEFDLSSLPTNVILSSSELSLYHNPNSANGDHSSLSGSNESVLQRVTSTWSENTVIWNNQPSSTSVNQVVLSQSITSNQDYINIDVTNLTQDILNMPSSSYGFLLKVANETAYRRMIFASSDHSNQQLHPKLKVCYSYTTDLISIDNEVNFSIFPNPSNNSFKISGNLIGDYQIDVHDLRGRLVYSTQFFESMIIDVSDFGKSMYFVTVSNDKYSGTEKLIVQ